MRANEKDARIRLICDLLEKLELAAEPSDEESNLLREAAWAVQFAYMTHCEEFQSYLSNASRPLTPDEMQRKRNFELKDGERSDDDAD